MADPRAQDVMDFLTSHGFARAASALRDDLLARSRLDGSPPPLPPVRTAPPVLDADDGAAAGSSSSSDTFVSMGSSPSEFRNPYGIWSPSRAKSEVSSDREFGTAREYNDFNIFSDTGWYEDQYPAYLNDPYPDYMNDPYLALANTGDCGSEDKFVMSIEAEKEFMNQDSKNSDGKLQQGESFVPLCDCCSSREATGRVGYSNASVYGRYQIMPDQTERLDECGEDRYQLKRMAVHPEVFLPKGVSLQERDKKSSELRTAAEEFHMLNTYAVEERIDGNPTCQPKISGSSNYNAKTSSVTDVDNGELRKRDFNWQIAAGKTSQLDTNKGRGLAECGTVDGGSQDPGAVGFEGEDLDSTDEPQLYNPHEDEYEIFDLRIVHRKNRTGFEENKDLPIVLNSVIAGRYYVTEYLGSAAFSKVVQAHDLRTGIDVCLKIIKNDKDFFDQSLDEIKLLKFVNKHDPADKRHILRLYDYFYHQEHLFIVCELLRANLYEFQKYNQDSGGEVYFTLPKIQAIAQQCLEALEYLHDLSIIHCDLKPENILIKSYSRCKIKIIDLGSSCFQTDNLCLYVQSRSYRAPEVILGLPYDQKIDIWSLGCVLAELYTGDVLFPNDSLVMMLARMIGILGPIDMEMLETGQETDKYFTDDYDLYHRNEETDQIEYLIPEKFSLAHHLQVSDTAFLDFLNCLLQINPKRRATASQALKHRWLSISYQ